MSPPDKCPIKHFKGKPWQDQRNIELHSHPQISSSWWWWWWRRREFAISCCCCEPSWGWVHNCWNDTCARSSLQVATKAEQNALQQWEIFFYNSSSSSRRRTCHESWQLHFYVPWVLSVGAKVSLSNLVHSLNQLELEKIAIFFCCFLIEEKAREVQVSSCCGIQCLLSKTDFLGCHVLGTKSKS